MKAKIKIKKKARKRLAKMQKTIRKVVKRSLDDAARVEAVRIRDTYIHCVPGTDLTERTKDWPQVIE
jgi:mRNA-degrading endonuclease RelE of RelBE toxin-antitoxin system